MKDNDNVSPTTQAAKTSTTSSSTDTSAKDSRMSDINKRAKESQFETEREAMASLVSRGFTEKFELKNDKLVSTRLNKTFELKNVNVVEVHGFEGKAQSSDNTVIFALEAVSSEEHDAARYKGVMQTTYGALSSAEIQKLVEKATSKREDAHKTW